MMDSIPRAEDIWRHSWGFASTCVLSAAVEVELFAAFAPGPADAQELARRTGCSLRGIEALTGALVGMGLLTRGADGRLEPTPTARYYLGPRPAVDLGPQLLHSKQLIGRWLRLGESVRSGQPLPRDPSAGEAGFVDLTRRLFANNHASANVLQAALADREGFRPAAVLDVGAGAAPWSIPFAAADRRCRVTAVDYPEVLSVTREFTERFAVADRYTFLGVAAESADLGSEQFDLVLVGHLYHSLGESASADLARRAAAALRVGGLLAVAEFVVDDDRTGPLLSLLFACNMLLGTALGSSYTARRIDDWARAAGLTPLVPVDIPGGSAIRLARKTRDSAEQQAGR